MNNFKKIIWFSLSFFSQSYAQSEVTINVWVHGTYPALKLLAHKHSPFRSWIYVPHGLSLAKELPYHYYFRQLAYECQARDKQEYCVDHFYTYGWHSSTIRPQKRKVEGEKLYQSLCKLMKKYKQNYDIVKVRLVGVSHGGNVVLHCMSCMPFDCQGVLTEVVLLATPVQESTRSYVNNHAAKRVYSFYSDADWMQCLDIQKLHSDAPKNCSFWSNRTFDNADRVVQVRLKIDGHFIGHGRYRSIVKYLPRILQQVDQRVQHKDKAHITLDFKTG